MGWESTRRENKTRCIVIFYIFHDLFVVLPLKLYLYSYCTTVVTTPLLARQA